VHASRHGHAIRLERGKPHVPGWGKRSEPAAIGGFVLVDAVGSARAVCHVSSSITGYDK
jgi:hypothetical protein